MGKGILASAEDMVVFRDGKREMFDNIQRKQQEFPAMRLDIQSIKEVPDESLIFLQRYIDSIGRKMLDDADMAAICELAKLYILDEQHRRGQIVHCQDCTIKKAVPHKGGMVWRCPHRTGDVKMDGYCECGRRGI